ncbi:Retrotransposable element Tf2 [Gossypium australe]|uniref:Retrotransposable element Tf2 n=1 Tax=Gossypium australe TaxID=47621 RepID=A0A5B6WP70_9ROSI|nr:Retrotransposable element Tf2 [Gossypium australe]
MISKAHSSTYSVHSSSTKMYYDLKQMYWWLGMKCEICDFIAKCLICQQTLADMLRCCILVFEGSWEKYLLLAEFAYNNSYQSSIKMASFEALYGRKCKMPLYWSKLSEAKLVGIDLIQETEAKV